MKFVGRMALCLVLITFTPLFADEDCSFCKIDRYAPDRTEKRLMCLADNVRLSRENLSKAKESIRCAVQEWKTRDGAAGFFISDAFLGMMEESPRAFFEVMCEDDSAFYEWLDRLDSLSFTWFAEQPSPLEAKRQRLIRFLARMDKLDGEAETLRLNLLSTLGKIRPRQVE